MSDKDSQHQPTMEPIAVVGMSALFPHAQGLNEYLRLLRQSEDAVGPVPASHWNAEDYTTDDPELARELDMATSARGGFLDELDFDPTEFGIPPTVLEATDTAQLLGLLTGKRALEDAGYGEEREFNRERTSVILGVTGTLELVVPLGARLGHPHWVRAMIEAGVDKETAQKVVGKMLDAYVPWQENSFPGLLGNVVAGRIANRLNLKGTNCVVDAACASSLAAIHTAVMELQNGKSDMVLTGGVDTFNDIFMFMCFTKTQALSQTGDAKPFSADADGTCLGEGVGMVVLKRLSDAERDGDHIHGLIRGIGTSSDGKSQSIYAPVSEGQARALRDAYKNADVDPGTIEMVEAHGTGTRVGDVVEFNGLKDVFGDSEREDKWCALGSVKSQIGHAKAGAGAASLIKALLSLKHKILPATIKVGTPNPKLEIESSPFYLNTVTRPWLRRLTTPRRAGISSFGFGGSNFHLVAEEASPEKTEPAWDGSVEMVAFSSSKFSKIGKQLKEWLAALDDRISNEQFAWRASESRKQFNAEKACRLLLVVEHGTDRHALFARALEQIEQGKPEDCNLPNIYFSREARKPGKLAFLFPGQGSQYVGMGRDLICIFPEAFEAIEQAGEVAETDLPLADLLFPQPATNEAEAEAQQKILTETQHAQPALGAVSRAMFEVLKRFGVKPDAVAGHSFGEIVAHFAAGHLPEEVMIRLASLRGRLMAASGGENGTMMAVRAPLEELKALLTRENFEAVLANLNSPDQGIVSGCREAVEKVRHACEKLGWPVRSLPVSAAFHSPLMDKARDAFAEALDAIGFEMPAEPCPVMANVTGEAYPTEASDCRQLLADQLVKPVQFVKTIETLYEDGVRTFVEVGPKSVLTGLVGRILEDRPHATLALDASAGRRSGMADLARSLAQLTAAGYRVALDAWERSAPEPRTPRMRVTMNGANYRDPKRKPAPAPSLKHYPDLPKARAAAPAPAAVPTPGAPAPQTPAPGTHGAKTTTMQNHANQPAPAAPTPSGDWLATVQEGLRAMQQLQQQTAAAHQQFLAVQERAHQAFQQVLSGAPATPGTPSLTAAQVPMAQPAPVVPQAPVEMPRAAAPMTHEPSIPPAPATNGHANGNGNGNGHAKRNGSGLAGDALKDAVIAVVSELTGYPVEMIEPGMDLEADLGIDSIKRVEILAAVQERVPGFTPESASELSSLRTLAEVIAAFETSAPVANGNGNGHVTNGHANGNGNGHHAPATSGIDAAEAVVAVVSELTGYPVEMIEPGMDLEADLGIDSIKRVEILAAVQDRVPGLGQIDASSLGSKRTLAEIVEALGTTEAPAVAPCTNGNGSCTATAAVNTSGLAEALTATVSELTGYPVEMIEPGMDLEADLGIDSIKRVEILAAVQDRVPGLPTVEAAQLNQMRTLGEIMEAYGTSGAGNSPEPVETAVGADTGEVNEVLTATVAELTGYPTEMIEPEMDLEADLGIDSIKRVEILAAVQERLPGLPALDASQMSQARTLGEIQSMLGDAAPALVAAGSKKKAEQPLTPAITLPDYAAAQRPGRFVLRAESLGDAAQTNWTGGTLAIVGDDSALAEALREALAGRDIFSIVATPEAFLNDHTNLEYQSLLYLAPARALDGAVWDAEGEAKLTEAFGVVQCAAPVLRAGEGQSQLLTVSQLDGAFGLFGHERDPLSGGVAALTKNAAREWPEVRCRALDLDPAMNSVEKARAIAEELLSTERREEVGLSARGRIGLTLDAAPLGNEGTTGLAKGDVVLVTGGARGVTAECITALACEAQPTFVLLGRSGAPAPEPETLAGLTDEAEIKRALMQQAIDAGEKPRPAELQQQFKRLMAGREIAANLARLRAAGSEVHYHAVDVCDNEAVAALVALVETEWGPVRGLIHGAGTIEDRRIEDKTPEQFERVVATKVAGLRNLLAALADAPLRQLVLFSSVSARVGNAGQVDYAMANEVLNKTAWREAARRPECRVVSINWGPWEGGMVTPELARQFERRGVGLIPLVGGAAAMIDEMRCPAGESAEIVIGEAFEQTSGNDDASNAQTTDPGKLSLAFEQSLSVETHCFLDSHRLKGRPVLPLAMMLEWFTHGALHANPGLQLHRLEAVRVCKGVILHDDAPLACEILASRSERDDDGNFCVALELRSRERTVLHASARAILGNGPCSPGDVPDASLDGTSYPLSLDQIYGDALFHGPHFHAFASLGVTGKDGMEATLLSAPAPAEWMRSPVRANWLLEPLQLDAALQMGILWTQARHELPSLPSALGALEVFTTGWAEQQTKATLSVSAASTAKLVADVWFRSLDGTPLACLRGAEWVLDAGLREAFGIDTAMSKRD